MLITAFLKKYERILNEIDGIIERNLTTLEKQKLLFLMEYKYKYYHQFPNGLNFIENLFLWLKNFHNPKDIEIALRILDEIIFFSQEEIQYLSQLLFRGKIRQYLLNKIIVEKNLDYYDYKLAYSQYWNEYLSQCIFIGLSDGAMIDYFRRTNNIDNEQTVAYYKLHTFAQEDIIKKFKGIKFYFLIEDFVASGTTFLRDDNLKNLDYWLDENNIEETANVQLPEPKKIKLNGSLIRFINYWNLNNEEDIEIIFCPYIITDFAKKRLRKIIDYYRNLHKIPHSIKIKIMPSYIFPDYNTNIFESGDYINLCEKYYDNYFIENEHHRKGGGCKFGFGKRGILIVRYNNTPSNSVYIIWHDNKGWHPVFKRNTRHKSELDVM